MGLKKRNIAKLKKILLANADRYDQIEVGVPDETCGTVQCMAGFCFLQEVGEASFRRRAAYYRSHGSEKFYMDVMKAGKEFLGIEAPEHTPSIFHLPTYWPSDLRSAYISAKTNLERAEVACQALDRLNLDGSLRSLETATA